MLSAPSTPAVAAIQALIVASLALSFGYLLVDAIIGAHPVDRLTRWALAFPGLVLFSFVLMLLHLLTRGHIFSNAWLTRGLTLATAAGLVALKRRTGHRARRLALSRRQTWTAVGLCVLAAVVWGFPIARVLPLNFTPDTDLHMGWATQLMIGESSPSTVITGN
ncbi:MAG: hypothetical protein M3P18_24880, partial [Actinomycetota bacterium]|nr:hypothetical protein [Actinomycetota bacterium]